MAVLTTAAAPPRASWTWQAALLAALAVWLLVVGAHHEPWVDESQAWLIARDNDLVTLLTRRVRYEGTPGLWHLLLWLCIGCGLPFAGLFLVSVTCALVGAALLLWRAPFPAPLRALLATSYFGAYQYAVVARSYALDLVLLPALACLFARRTERPIAYGVLIGLLANCNAHSVLIAAALGLEWLIALIRAHRLQAGLTGLTIAVALGLLALLVAWQPADNAFIQPGTKPPAMFTAVRFVGEAFVDRLAFWSTLPPSPLNQLNGVRLSLLLLIPSIILFFRAGLLPLVASMIALLIGFSALTYANVWHSGLLFLVWIFALWIAWPSLSRWPALARAVVATLALVAIVQTTEAATAGLRDIRHPYSGSAQAAHALATLRAEHPAARIAAAGFKTFAVQPYFPANAFANYQQGRPRPAYIVWQRGEPWRPFAPLAEADAAAVGGDDLLLVSAYGSTPEDFARFEQEAAARGYRRLAVYPGSLDWKGYAFEDDTLVLLAR